MFSFESPYRRNSYEYTQYIIFNTKKKKKSPTSAAMGFFLGTQERVRDSHGKRAISIRATEVLLYIHLIHDLSLVNKLLFASGLPFNFRKELEQLIPGTP